MASTGRFRIDEMAPYYEEAEQALKISGPVNYPWGPPRRRYPYREHEMNASGLVLARGAEKLGVRWASTPLATVSAPRGKSPPCVYRGFCNFGCSTNAKQSALIVWIPRALTAGAEVRDLAMVGRIEMGSGDRVTRRALSSRRRMALSERETCGGGRLRDRDAAPAAQLGLPAVSARSGQQLRPGRHTSHHARRPRRMGHFRGRNPLVQGSTQHGSMRTLELRRRRQGLPRCVCIHEPRSAAARMGANIGNLALPVGRTRCARKC